MQLVLSPHIVYRSGKQDTISTITAGLSPLEKIEGSSDPMVNCFFSNFSESHVYDLQALVEYTKSSLGVSQKMMAETMGIKLNLYTSFVSGATMTIPQLLEAFLYSVYPCKLVQIYIDEHNRLVASRKKITPL
jgi:hypothetical protein